MTAALMVIGYVVLLTVPLLGLMAVLDRYTERIEKDD